MTTNFKPGTPNWLDIGTTDMAGTKAFYGSLFGWTIDDLGPDYGNYGIIRKDGKQVGGIGPATDPTRGSSWSVFFATDNVDDTAAKVDANGGKTIMAPGDVMDQGRMAVFVDPQGAYFSAWQPGKHHGAELVDEIGAMCWAELMTTDMPAAKAFYESVLPITTRDVPISDTMMYTLFVVDGKNVAGAMTITPDMGDVPTSWSIYFAVADCDATANKAIELGARELVREDSPAGRFAMFLDPQGAQFAILAPNPNFSM